jgi:hypothetical protein
MEGFVLLKSLLAMAALLVCMAALLAAAAGAVKQSGFLQNAAASELEYRNVSAGRIW